jgi:hypothetical protein
MIFSSFLLLSRSPIYTYPVNCKLLKANEKILKISDLNEWIKNQIISLHHSFDKILMNLFPDFLDVTTDHVGSFEGGKMFVKA